MGLRNGLRTLQAILRVLIGTSTAQPVEQLYRHWRGWSLLERSKKKILYR
jgi:hypothetical protein